MGSSPKVSPKAQCSGFEAMDQEAFEEIKDENLPVGNKTQNKHRIPATQNNAILNSLQHIGPKKKILKPFVYDKVYVPRQLVYQITPPLRTPSLNFLETRDHIMDLANRALANGFRQPLNFIWDTDDKEKYDDWNRDEQEQRYGFSKYIVPVDFEDPVDVLTSNLGMVKYHFWQVVWSDMRFTYVQESLLPDIRAVYFHESKTYETIAIIERELLLLEGEQFRSRVYTEDQIDMIRDGIKHRLVWFEDLQVCLRHLETFHTILNEFPVDAMFGKKWFDNFKTSFSDGRDFFGHRGYGDDLRDDA